MKIDPAALKYDERGLLAVVVQDVASGAVLMLGFANREAVEATLETGLAHFYSRSRQKLWRKGETSGNVLEVVEILADCDGDALVVRARPHGPTCHRETRSCFEPNPVQLELGWLWQVLEERRSWDPQASYTSRLLAAGVHRVARKVGEEAAETIIAALQASYGEDPHQVTAEVADLIYHLLVLLQSVGIVPADVAKELENRHWKP